MGIFRGNVKFMGILCPKLWFIFFGLRASTFLDVCWFCQPCLSHVEAACSFIPFRFFLAYGSFFALNIMIIAEIRRIPGLSSCLTLAKMGWHWAPIGLPLGSSWVPSPEVTGVWSGCYWRPVHSQMRRWRTASTVRDLDRPWESNAF